MIEMINSLKTILYDEKCIWKMKIEQYKAEKKWNRRFPIVSFHPPYVSQLELDDLERILEKRRCKGKT